MGILGKLFKVNRIEKISEFFNKLDSSILEIGVHKGEFSEIIFNKFEPKDLELTESIEILRLIENGYKVVAKKINTPLIDINYPNDIKKATSFLKKK